MKKLLNLPIWICNIINILAKCKQQLLINIIKKLEIFLLGNGDFSK
jgi:hypothetical protein